MAYVQTIQGLTGYLQAALITLLPDLNAEIVRKAERANPPTMRLVIGEPDNLDTGQPGTPPPGYFFLYAASGQNADLAQRQDRETVYMTIDVFIPKAGDCQPSDFEIVKQVVLDMTKHTLSTLGSQIPNVVFTSDGGTARAIRARWGSWATLLAQRMADGVTYARNYQIQWSAEFQIVNA